MKKMQNAELKESHSSFLILNSAFSIYDQNEVISMLNLILGRASSGKTTYVRNIIAERVREGKQATLIVPEQFSFESERAIVSLLGAKDAASVRIVSFSSLSKKILDEYEPDRKPPVTQAAKAVLMSMTLEATAEHLELF